MSNIHIDAHISGLREHGDPARINVYFEKESHLGHQAKLEVVQHVHVKDSDPEHAEKTLHTESFMIASRDMIFDIPADIFPAFDYDASKIAMRSRVRVTVDDGIIFDSSNEIDLDLGSLPRSDDALVGNVNEAFDPKDNYSLSRNFAAISFKQKLALIGVFFVGIVAGIANLILGIFDTFISSVPFLYGGDGLGMFSGIGGMVIGGIGFAFTYKKILRSYMTAKVRSDIPVLKSDRDYRPSDLFTARSAVNLTGVTLRVVVGNLQKGQYWRGSGTDRSKTSFAMPTRAIMVYEKTTAAIPKGAALESYFNDRISFDDVFKALHPQQMVSSTHGLELRCEVQIMVAKLADTELVIDGDNFLKADFLHDD